mmetsp:Transcript_2739/g.3242  ORF Transcript_2739/g.3242 Transcript_2739/m.3242 type:complete len:164 (+) Transcript_2739:137-628(+)
MRYTSLEGSTTAVGTPGFLGMKNKLEEVEIQHYDDEVLISREMQLLRGTGILIIAHRLHGRPKTVRLKLTESAITWRTEIKRSNGKRKIGKTHTAPLARIMYVDIGKNTAALKKVENASVPDYLCFSLLTKEDSLNLEVKSLKKRDILVNCFSLVLDEVHARR